MFRRRRKPSVYDEPQFRAGKPAGDPWERRAEHTLGREHAGSLEAYRPGGSVYDEPDILPGRVGEFVAQDWTCRNCGYNLRGHQLEKPCPECGRREWYRPAPAGRDRFRQWLSARQQAVSARRSWLSIAGAALTAGPFAVIAALLYGPPGLSAMSVPLIAIVFAPVLEEALKIGAAALLVELKPYLFRDETQIYVAAVGAAVLFAAIENVLYLTVYISNPGLDVVLWRWTACVVLHAGCSAVAARGLVNVWRECVAEFRPPRIGAALPLWITAILLHAAYNAAALGYSWLF